MKRADAAMQLGGLLTCGCVEGKLHNLGSRMRKKKNKVVTRSYLVRSSVLMRVWCHCFLPRHRPFGADDGGWAHVEALLWLQGGFVLLLKENLLVGAKA